MTEPLFLNKCPNCNKEIDLMQIGMTYSHGDEWECPYCKHHLKWADMLATMKVTIEQKVSNSFSSTAVKALPASLHKLHDQYGGENIINADPEVDIFPDVIWYYDYSKYFSKETLERIKSAGLVRAYYGGKRDGMPFKRSYEFVFWDKVIPNPSVNDPIATITFTLNLEDGTIRSIEGIHEFKKPQSVVTHQTPKVTKDFQPNSLLATKNQDTKLQTVIYPLLGITIFGALISLFIFLQPATQAPKEEQRITIGLVSSQTANIRSGPSQNNPIVSKVRLGDTLVVVSQVNDWLFVKQNNTEGYIHNKLVKQQVLIK